MADWFGDDAAELEDMPQDAAFCECNDNPTEDEMTDNQCDCCGGMLW